VSTDIDIDVGDREKVVTGLPCVPAAMMSSGERQRHNTGVYFQDVPVDPIDGLCAFLHKDAAELGYFKIDILSNTIYKQVRDEAHLIDLLDREPPWELLDDPEIVGMLAHIKNHFDIVQFIKPRSIEDLAIVIALPRPGKVHLIGKPRHVIDAEIWLKSDQYYFKKPHAISYAASIVVQLNLIVEQNT
jgi:hypothetical protein